MIFDDLDDDDGEDFWSIPSCALPAIEIEAEIGFDDLPAHTRHKPEWWQRSESEYWDTDYPEFDSMMDRGRYIVEQMGRSALAANGGDDDDQVLERPDGSPVSLSELLEEMLALEMGSLRAL